MKTKTTDVVIAVPTVDALMERTPQVCLKIRESSEEDVPFTKDALEQMGKGVNAKGVYVHLWKKSPREKVVLYVGQTGQSFRKRLNWEFSLQHNPVSEKFRTEIRKHIGKKDVITVFFDESVLAKMVSGCKMDNKTLRLLVEQAMIAAYSEKYELLNVYADKDEQ